MIIYIDDTTVRPPKEVRFGTYTEAVRYLEQMSVRAYGQNRKQRMLVLEEIGHGYDDSDAVNFVRSMAAEFNMGVVREACRIRCDITALGLYQRSEFGN